VSYPPRQCDIKVDVVVVGAGITGITAALLLARRNKHVVLIDKDKVAMGESGATTAHLTEILDTPYRDLISKFGIDHAREVRDAGRAAIETIHSLSRELGIPCSFERVPAVIYAETESEEADLKKELVALNELGIPARWMDKPDLPYPTLGALKVGNQAQFHPRKYLLGLAEAFVKLGGIILEETKAEEFIEGHPAKVVTNNGIIEADQVVVAANVPITNRLFLQTKIAAYRTYAIGVRLAQGSFPKGLYWDCREPYHYIRTQTIESPGYPSEEVLIVGGEDHKTGMEPHTEDRFGKLEKFTRSRFEVASVPFRWSGQVIEPVDGLPYIGPNSFSDNFYVATGFSGNGMTLGTISGMMISDAIAGIENPWTKVFDATRITLAASAVNYVTENKDFPTCIVKDRLEHPPDLDLSQIEKNEGALVSLKGEKVAVNRDASGHVKFFSPVCPHMGCYVHWNSAEKSWDCPCHGSRFDCDGKVLNGPALSDLREIPPSEVFEKKRDKDKGRTRPTEMPAA